MKAQCQFCRSNRIYWSHYLKKKKIHKIDFRWPVFASRKLKHAYRPSHFPLEFFCKAGTFPTLFCENLKLSIWNLLLDEESKVPFKMQLNIWKVSYQDCLFYCFVLWNKTFFRDTYVKRHIFGAKFEPPLGFIPSSNKIQV